MFAYNNNVLLYKVLLHQVIHQVFRFSCVHQEIARHLRPGTLRAVFGKNKIQNAVHCTDLPEDGLLEVRSAR